jgi:hypothetical protein
MSELIFELEFTRSYLDDPKRVEEVFTRLESSGMKLNVMNIHVCCDELEY